MTLTDDLKKDSGNPIKRCYLIGKNLIVGIDSEIAYKLNINESDTVLEQKIVENGILMKVKKLENYEDLGPS